MEKGEEQQYCLRWNNFQANFTSQFEALRDDEDFTDVTIACEGQKLQAHRVVLSACSPYFKEIFKANPCSHPIIFMRDVEAHHVTALLEFMYAGEVNVAQAHLSAFLKTAESLKIRGLTDSPSQKNKENDTLTLNPKSKLPKTSSTTHKRNDSTSNQSVVPTTAACSSTVTSSQDDNVTNVKLEQLVKTSTVEAIDNVDQKRGNSNNSANFDEEDECLLTNEDDLLMDDDDNDNDIGLNTKDGKIDPKLELADYLSDDEGQGYYAEGLDSAGMGALLEGVNFQGGMEIIPQSSNSQDHNRKYQSPEQWSHFESTIASNPEMLLSRLQHRGEDDENQRIIQLGEGIEVYEHQLLGCKWNDYRKLTRSLAAILFSPAELATCSVTGQRWSRAGAAARPVKPALNKAKVQAIISYVATRFPMVEITRIKQVLAYKCKENCAAFKMKALGNQGYFGHGGELSRRLQATISEKHASIKSLK